MTRINNRIRVPEIRCIDADGTQLGVMQTREAQDLAKSKGLDLVEIAAQAKPPVCRIMDYGKYKYEQGKKKKQARKHQSHTKLKEIKFHSNVAEHDYQTKLRHAREFLEHGHRVKFSLFFRGREGAHKELGFELMNRVMHDLKDDFAIEQPPHPIGRSIFMMVIPSRKN